MEFRKALASVYKNKSRKVSECPMLMYGAVLDLVKGSFIDKDKAKQFYQVDKELFIIKTLADRGVDGITSLKSQYSSVSNVIKQSSFNQMIDMTAGVMGLISPPVKQNKSPNRTISKVKRQVNQGVKQAENQGDRQNTQQKPKQSPNQKNVAVVKTNNPPKPKQNNKPVNQFNNAPAVPYNSTSDSLDYAMGLCFIVAIIMAVAAAICGIFHIHISWNGWQWIIGIGVGAVVGFIGVIITCECDDNGDGAIGGFFVYLIQMIANIVLSFMFKGSYNIIFCCASVAFFIPAIFYMAVAFSEEEEEWGTALIIAMVASILFTVFRALFIKNGSSWLLWQWTIGIFGGALISLGVVMACVWIVDGFDEYIDNIITIAVTGVNFLLYLIFRQNYFVIFCCFSVLFTFMHGAVTWILFDDCEEGLGTISIIETLINIGLFVVTLIWLR